jgi:hypothetical protein
MKHPHLRSIVQGKFSKDRTLSLTVAHLVLQIGRLQRKLLHFYGNPTIRPSGYRNRRGEGTILNPQLADFDDKEGHVVGEGAVPPCNNAVENCLLHICGW